MAATYQHKIKHLGCGLHFTVYSWKEDWPQRTIICPECAGDGGFLIWSEPSDGEIFEFVPGDTPLMEATTNG